LDHGVLEEVHELSLHLSDFKVIAHLEVESDIVAKANVDSVFEFLILGFVSFFLFHST
jgi:hypothetical protein